MPCSPRHTHRHTHSLDLLQNVKVQRLERALEQLQQREHLCQHAMEASARKDADIDRLQQQLAQAQTALHSAEQARNNLEVRKRTHAKMDKGVHYKHTLAIIHTRAHTQMSARCLTRI